MDEGVGEGLAAQVRSAEPEEAAVSGLAARKDVLVTELMDSQAPPGLTECLALTAPKAPLLSAKFLFRTLRKFGEPLMATQTSS